MSPQSPSLRPSRPGDHPTPGAGSAHRDLPLRRNVSPGKQTTRWWHSASPARLQRPLVRVLTKKPPPAQPVAVLIKISTPDPRFPNPAPVLTKSQEPSPVLTKTQPAQKPIAVLNKNVAAVARRWEEWITPKLGLPTLWRAWLQKPAAVLNKTRRHGATPPTPDPRFPNAHPVLTKNLPIPKSPPRADQNPAAFGRIPASGRADQNLASERREKLLTKTPPHFPDPCFVLTKESVGSESK